MESRVLPERRLESAIPKGGVPGGPRARAQADDHDPQADASTDIGKITTLATLDAFRKLIEDARPRLEARLVPAKPPAMVPPASAPLPAQAVQPLPQPNPGTPKR